MSLENEFHLTSKLKYFGYLRDRYSPSIPFTPSSGSEESPLGREDDLTFYYRLAAGEALFELLGIAPEKMHDVLQGNMLPVEEENNDIWHVLSYVTLDTPTDDRALLERQISSAIVAKHALPKNLEEKVDRDPFYLADLTRMLVTAKHVRYSATKKTSPLSKTSLWHFSILNPDAAEDLPVSFYDRPDVLFYNDPPVNPSEIPSRNSLLVVGTNVEVRDVELFIEERFQNKLTIPDSNLIEYASRMGSFWKNFFNVEKYLDTEGTKPIGVVTTGFMRNYGSSGGETVDVAQRLEEIAQWYEIPLRFIPPTHI